MKFFYQDGNWRYIDTGDLVGIRSCRHCGKDPISVCIKIPEDLSLKRRRYVQIDACIADIVKALQNGGIDMRGCCCGHGDRPGSIILQDGRILEIKK